jgi:site-specific DNA-adenine methylase
MARYGICYMGSKNSIAEEIVNLLPSADNLYDLFCGGGAITHCAITKNKYVNYYMNDLKQGMADFFLDCVKGKYKNENRWISREEFKKSFKTDNYISCVWSFGNKGFTYIYGQEVEPFKKALHYAIFFNDMSLLKECGYDLPKCDIPLDEIDKRRKHIISYVKSLAKIKGDVKNEKVQLQSLESLQRLQSLERLQALNEIKISDNVVNRIHPSSLDYSQVEIKPNSVIYCDIPYEGTSSYLCNANDKLNRTANNFDYNKFYEWACMQKELVVISSYEIIDDRFICVFEREKVSLLNQHAIKQQGKEKLVKIERLYIPKHQLNLWKKHNTISKQLDLFDFI